MMMIVVEAFAHMNVAGWTLWHMQYTQWPRHGRDRGREAALKEKLVVP